VAYLSAGFRLFGFDAGWGRVGGFSGGVGCGVWRGSCGWWFWGFCFLPRPRRDLREALRRSLVDGDGGRRFSLSWAWRRSVCGFSPRRRSSPPSRRRCGVETGGWRSLPRRSSPCFSRRWRPGSSLRWAGCAARLPGWLAAWGCGGPGAGRVWRRCRLRVVWFGPRFLVCAAAT